jgi:hypothetical protein
MPGVLRGYLCVFKPHLDGVAATIGQTLPTVRRCWDNTNECVDFQTECGAFLARVSAKGRDGVVSKIVVEMPRGAEYDYLYEAFTLHFPNIPVEFHDPPSAATSPAT